MRGWIIRFDWICYNAIGLVNFAKTTSGKEATCLVLIHYEATSQIQSIFLKNVMDNLHDDLNVSNALRLLFEANLSKFTQFIS